MKIRILVATTLVVATASLSASAQQQPWIKDRRYGEGIGIRAGNLELHPGVEGQVGYDSNYFQRSGEVDNQVDEPVVPALRFRLTPSLTLATLGGQRTFGGAGHAPPTVNFRAGVNASYNELVALQSKDSSAVSKQRHINAGANFNLHVLPQRPWGAEFMGDFVRIAEPSNFADTNAAFNRDSLRLGGGIVWEPGGGLFDWHLGYELRYNYFEKQTFREYNNFQHYVKTRGRWRFLPRTALLYDASLGFLNYSNATTQSNSTPVRARLGLNGLVTNHFAVLAMAGWGASFYTPRNGHPPQNYDSLIAQGELKWYILPKPNLSPDKATVGLSSIALGYIRDFHNSYLGDYYGRDRGYINFAYFAGGVVLVKLEGGFSHLRYPPSYYLTGAQQFGAFSENRVDASLFAEYRLSDSFGINTTLRYNADLTATRVPVNPAATALDNLKFNRFEAYLGARWFM